MIKKLAVALSLLALFAACGKGEQEAEKTVVKKAVKSIEIETSELSRVIEGATTLEPKLEAGQTSPGGEVVEVYYKNGDRVEEGDIVILLEDDRVESTYKSTKASYLSAKAQFEQTEKFAELEVRNGLKQAEAAYVNALELLNKAKRGGNAEERAIATSAFKAAETAFKEAELNLAKNEDLYAEELISQDQYLRVQTAYNQASAGYAQAKNNLQMIERGADQEDINTLEAALKNAEGMLEIARKNVEEEIWNYSIQMANSNYMGAEAQYKLAKIDYEELEVRAKLSGVVTNLYNKKFDEVEGKDVLFTVVDDTAMEFSVGVNVQDVVELSEGNRVRVKLRDIGKEVEGVLVEVDPSANVNDRKFMVKGIVENPTGQLKKGMYANALIEGNSKEGIAVPKEAVVIKGLYKYLYKVEDGVAKRVTVETGSDYGGTVEITSGDIAAGDMLVVEGQYLLENNDLVEEVK